MLAMTVRLPWAAAQRAGEKRVENRGGRAGKAAARHVGEDIAVHAAATWCRIGAADQRIRDWYWGPHSRLNGQPLDAVDFGPMFRQVLAVASLVDVHEAEQPQAPDVTCCGPWGDRLYNGAPAWHLVLGSVHPVWRRRPAVGRQSVLWPLPAEIAAAVIEEVGWCLG